MMEAIFNEVVIARNADTVLLEGNHYFPRHSVEERYLARSWTTSVCLWKGVASYYTVEVNGARSRDAAWTYRHPSPLARKIKNHVAFWGGVQVIDEPVREG